MTANTLLARILRPLLLAVLLLAGSVHAAGESYPAQCRVTTGLNVRSGPGTGYAKMGLLRQGDCITVNGTTYANGRTWGEIDYGGRRGYVAMQYVRYLNAVAPAPQGKVKGKAGGFAGFLKGVWSVARWLLLVVVVVLVFIFWEDIFTIAIFLGLFAGGGALLFGLLFHNAGLGALIGLGVAAFLGLRIVFDSVGDAFSTVFLIAYYVVSFPFYLLNLLEHVLVSPWRYMFKTSWVGDGVKPVLRVVLEILTVVMYIATTPLRLVNAVVYNILIHCVTGIYDLFFEVLVPCDPKEGAGHFGRWLLMFPWRLLKYPVYHGLLAVVESVVWTVVDLFIPAATMYHGTDLKAGEAIASDPYRNKYLKNTSKWSYGTFTASTSSWGGIGVYFASLRSVARGYANDPYRLDDDNPVMIACRVSLGRTINYALAPSHIYNQAGQNGRHAELNRYGEKHGYVTGEWWNPGGRYWEYCMFDWQNRYNHPWRIRPIYILNFRTGRAQHIRGGMQHWLFDRTVWKDIVTSLGLG